MIEVLKGTVIILYNLNSKDYFLESITSPKMPHFPDEIEYSEKYQDDLFEYRHVLLPKNIYKKVCRGRLLVEQEWRAIGVQ